MNKLNRKALGKIVFNSAKDLKWLNQLTHPEVSKELYQQLSQVTSPYVILDIPLLIDKSGVIPEYLRQVIDRVVVIDITVENQIQRLCNRDNISPVEAQTVIDNQSTLFQKLALADDVINNNGDLSELESQAELLHNQYVAMINHNINNPSINNHTL